MTSNWRPNIYNYFNFRNYMRDYYELAKTHTRHVSFRYLARRAGFRSPNFIKLVMDGDRNLSEQGAQKVAIAFELEDHEISCFVALVRLGQLAEEDARRDLLGLAQPYAEPITPSARVARATHSTSSS